MPDREKFAVLIDIIGHAIGEARRHRLWLVDHLMKVALLEIAYTIDPTADPRKRRRRRSKKKPITTH